MLKLEDVFLYDSNFPVPQNQVADLKEMCSALKQDKADVEKKLSHISRVCQVSCSFYVLTRTRNKGALLLVLVSS